MRGLLWLLAALVIAAGLSVVMRDNEGYVLLIYSPWRVELSLNFFVVLLVTAFFAAYAIVRMVSSTLGLPAYVREFRERRRLNKARQALVGSQQALFEGRYGRAVKLAARAHDTGTPRTLAALVAARAAHRMRNPALRDGWLERARQGEPDWQQAALAAQAEMLLDERRYSEARAVLRSLHEGGARHIATLSALLRAEQGVGNWDEVVRLARVLEKREALPAEALQGMVVGARVAMLARKGQDARELAEYWRPLPRAEQHHPRIAAAAASEWIRLGDQRAAQRLIESALASNWDAELVLLYGQCGEPEALERIERGEAWLAQRPQDPELLLTLGRLCAKRGLWGKARSYLEASLSVRPGAAVNQALAQLCERIGQADEAARYYRAAAQSLEPAAAGSG